MKINFNRAEYMLASHYPHQWPSDIGAEVAFAGRSNVGKSSAINAITNKMRLARTSKTPGRTQQIVFFQLYDDFRLVDLPGYGYAKAPEKLRQHWKTLVTQYLFERQSLRALIIPMDIRRPFTELDVTMLECCWQANLAAHILLTKSDKLKRGGAKNTYLQVCAQVKNMPQTSVQLFSSLKSMGVDEARQVISQFLLMSELS